MLRDDAVRRLPYWDKLNDVQKNYLADNSLIRKYAAGEEVHGYGSACLGAILVLKGSMRVYVVSEDGREITLFSLCEDDACVLSASCVIGKITFEINTVAEEDCELLVTGAKAFDKLSEENVYVKCFMYEIATQRLSDVMQTLQNMLFSGIDKRIAGFLLSEYRRTSDAVIKITQEQIAVRINSAREVVARTLKRFESEGLVKLKRGSVTLTDIGGLKNI